MITFIKNYSEKELQLSDDQKECAVKIAVEIMNNIGMIKQNQYLDRLTGALTPDLRQILKDKYPNRRLVILDSLCSSGGYGLLLDYCADLRDEGKSIEKIKKW